MRLTLSLLSKIRLHPHRMLKATNIAKHYPAIRVPVKARYVTKESPYSRAKNCTLYAVRKLILEERTEVKKEDYPLIQANTECLLGLAIRHGDRDEEILDVLQYWLGTEQLLEKVLKVLVPRFQDHIGSYTKKYNAPNPYAEVFQKFRHDYVILELAGNPFPSLEPLKVDSSQWIHNVLLSQIRKSNTSS